MSLYELAEWLEQTAGSTAIRESIWVYPIIETTHVLSLCLFLGLIALMDLRLLGVALPRVSITEIVKRVLPWAVLGFVVSVVSGLLLFYSTPVRMTHNIFFRFKVLMLLAAGANAWLFHVGIYRRVADWDDDRILPRRARLSGIVSLALWASIVVSGRMIAYNWFDCDKPQPPIVNALAGCRTEGR